MFVNFLLKWAIPCVAILPQSGTATAVPAAPPTVQISKRSSQSYTGLTAILHTTLNRLYSTDHFALCTPAMHADSEMHHMWRPYIVVYR